MNSSAIAVWMSHSVTLHVSSKLCRCPSALHSGSKWLKPAKNKLTWSDVTSFFEQDLADFHIASIYSHKACDSKSKFVKSFQAKVWSVNFTKFLNVVFGGFLSFGPTVRCAAVQRRAGLYTHMAKLSLLLLLCWVLLAGLCCFKTGDFWQDV